MTRIKLSLAAAIALLTWLPGTLTAQRAEPQPPGAYYSAQKPHDPPFPFNPFPDLSTVEVAPKRFVYDDTQVDYGTMQMQSASMAPPLPGEGGGGGGTNPAPYLPPTVPVPGQPLLQAKMLDQGVVQISFDSEPGLVYRIDESGDLSSGIWTEIDRLVATDTRTEFLASDGTIRFYRVFKEDDRIQFPDWFDSIEQYAQFRVWTPITSGTYSLELYADGVLQFTDAQPIPPDGAFGVSDLNYDPSLWPYVGYYNVDEWELRVTVTPTVGAGQAAAAPAQTTVKKKGKRRHPGAYRGITVQQLGIANPNAQAQDDLDVYMWTYMMANLQASRQKKLDEQELDEFATSADVPRLADATGWSQLRSLLTGSTKVLDYIHYFGRWTAQ